MEYKKKSFLRGRDDFSLQTVNINRSTSSDSTLKPVLFTDSFLSFPHHLSVFFCFLFLIMCNETMKVESVLNSTHTLVAQA